MTQVELNEEAPYPNTFGVERWWSDTPDEEGRLTIPDDHDKHDEIVARCKEVDRVTVLDESEGESEATPELSYYTESDIVEMDYREKQSLAGSFDDIQGNASDGELEEALILKVRDANES